MLQNHLKANFKNFMTSYEAKQSKLISLQSKEKDLVTKNCEQKKKWIKKHSDLVSLARGQEIESDDPFHLFLKQMHLDREKRRKEELLAE